MRLVLPPASVGLFLILFGFPVPVSAQECSSPGICLDCELYMAESTIPHAGWGIFTAKPLKKDTNLSPVDVDISVVDHDAQMEFDDKNVPAWLMDHYLWSAVVTQTVWDANQVNAVVPGFGMLANSHTGLMNLDNDGCDDRSKVDRADPSAGAFSHTQQQTFSTSKALPAGAELFANYGDMYFSSRTKVLGVIPLSEDFDKADMILDKWQALGRNVTEEMARDIWDDLIIGIYPLMNDRMRVLLPLSHDDAVQAANRGGVAATLLEKTTRSVAWLQQNGMCLDHFQVQTSTVVPNQNGAFAKRNIAKGMRVAPVPVIHLSRKHLEIYSEDDQESVWWKGNQLLLNYCYGHKDSSLLLFPYSPGVNLFNHAGHKATANVALRWSNKSTHPEWLDWTVDQVLQHNQHAGLVLEIYALRDLKVGDELLLDYGDEWQEAWDKHVADWSPPVHADDYQSSWDYEVDSEIYTLEDPSLYPPSYVQVRCWVDVDLLKSPDDEGWRAWVKPFNGLIDATVPCRVVSADYDNKGQKESYRVIVEATEDEPEVKVKAVGWDGITYVEKPYTGHQYLRQAFRHEIHVPDGLYPEIWEDLKERPEDAERCGLYMAESAIPNAGLGMYTAKPIPARSRIYYGDVVVQVEDYSGNNNLRREFLNAVNESGDLWLLNSYYWNPGMTNAQHEAYDVESIVPGLGMLANSHPGLVNADLVAPRFVTDLERSKDPGAGASTNYHDVHYIATQDIVQGEELFVKYGDSWFLQRRDITVPLENDFIHADRLVNRFWNLLGDNAVSDVTQDAWVLVENVLSSKERLAAALPRDIPGIKRVVDKGSADYSTPDRVRSLEWLKRNGRCLDNIKPGKSSIPQAGGGAFATRKIRKSDIIAPVPVVQILRRDLEIFDRDNYGLEHEDEDDEGEIRYLGKQQILNYCYGHPQSSILLFPYSPVVNYVNHNATAFNAKLHWSTLPSHRKDWLKRSPEDLANEPHSGLILELVATRDIQVGEEILLHYGSDYEQAWKDYVVDWYLDDEVLSYVPAAALNERVEWLRLQDELEEDPYPDNVFTACFVGQGMTPSNTGLESEYEEYGHFKWTYYESIYDNSENARPCEVLRRDNVVPLDEAVDLRDSIKPANVRYTVVVHPDPDEPQEGQVVNGVPRLAIRFFDVPYSSDMFLRQGFRHEIQLPDSLVPNEWRDLA